MNALSEPLPTGGHRVTMMFMNQINPRLRFREVRERLGLNESELAIQSGLCAAAIWDIEACEGDLTGIQPDKNNDNGIPFHHYTTGHAFLFNQTKILAREKNAFRRKVIEGIHIANKKNSCVNIIAGKKIENIWMPLVQDLRLS